MSKYYGIAFSNSDPGLYPSLSPTFLTFKNALSGADVTPPTISQLSTSGIYGFTFSATFPAYFRVDGVTIASLADRYVIGMIDPVSDVDSQLTNTGVSILAIGSSNIALGTTAVAIGESLTAQGISIYAIATTLGTLSTLLGDTTSTFGTVSVDPTTIFGYLKRMQEYSEGSQVFNKTSGAWAISSRGGSLIVSKTLGNTSSQVTRS
jgi:hypothetical protein